MATSDTIARAISTLPSFLSTLLKLADKKRSQSNLGSEAFRRRYRLTHIWKRLEKHKSPNSLAAKVEAQVVSDVIKLMSRLGIQLNDILRFYATEPWASVATGTIVVAVPAREVKEFAIGKGGGSNLSINVLDFWAADALVTKLREALIDYNVVIEPVRNNAKSTMRKLETWQEDPTVVAIISLGSSRISQLTKLIAQQPLQAGLPHGYLCWDKLLGKPVVDKITGEGREGVSFIRYGRETYASGTTADGALVMTRVEEVGKSRGAKRDIVKGVVAGLGGTGTMAGALYLGQPSEYDGQVLNGELSAVVQVDTTDSPEDGWSDGGVTYTHVNLVPVYAPPKSSRV